MNSSQLAKRLLLGTTPVVLSYFFYTYEILKNEGSFENQPLGVLFCLLIFFLMLIFISMTSNKFISTFIWSVPVWATLIYLGIGHSEGKYVGWGYLEEAMIILLNIIVISILFIIYTIVVIVRKNNRKG